MRRRKQPRHKDIEHLPSTTRAVAWSALLFSFLALVISTVTFFLTFRDGELVENAGMLMEDVGALVDRWQDERAVEGDTGSGSTAARQDIEAKLDRYAEMIEQGDEQARYYLDNLMVELEGLRETSVEKGSAWIETASENVQRAREELTENGPAAVERLRTLADELREAFPQRPDGEGEQTQ